MGEPDEGAEPSRRTPSAALLSLLVCYFALGPSAAHSSHPVRIFEPGPTNMLSPSGMTQQRRLTGEGDYGESWFHVVHTEGGDLLYVLMSITNLGIRNGAGLVSVYWYPSDGEPRNLHREVTRREVTTSKERMDIRIGPGRTWKDEGRFHVEVNDPEMKLRLELARRLPGHQLGDGRVGFYEDERSEWAIAFNSPRADVTGSIEIGGDTTELDGVGYHDRIWSTIKVPTFAKKWYTLRFFHEEHTLIAHQIHLEDRFGGGTIDIGLLGTGTRLLGEARTFTFNPVNRKLDEESGYRYPTAVEFSMGAGGYSVSGTARETRFLDSIDVLGRISRPIRAVIRTFYSKPYMLRYEGDYELDVESPDGETVRISGKGVMEATFY